VSSSMSSVGYRHDNSALTEQRVAQILSEARAAMKAVDAARTQVYYSMSYWHRLVLTMCSHYELRCHHFHVCHSIPTFRLCPTTFHSRGSSHFWEGIVLSTWVSRLPPWFSFYICS